MKIRKILIGIISSLAVVVLFLSICLLFGLVYVLLPQNGTESKTEGSFTHKYQSLQFDPTKNETSLGTIEIFNEIEGESQSYVDSEGNYVLLSNFGTEEYKCTGSCWCEEERRLTSSLVRKSLIFFVASVSSVVAYGQARNYFEEKCVKDLEDSCPSASSIRSVIDRCQLAVNRWSARKAGDPEEHVVEYMCGGKCTPVDSLMKYARECQRSKNDFNYKQEIFDKMFVCHQYELDGVKVVVTIPVGVSSEQSLDMAKVEFEKLHLNSFCVKSGQISDEDIGLIDKGYMELEKSDQIGDTLSWCSSSSPFTRMTNIICRKYVEEP